MPYMEIASGRIRRNVLMSMQSQDVRDVLTPRCSQVNEQISYNREERDQWNSKVRALLDQRNELNRQVKELITEVQNQKGLRDEQNQIVRDLKELRAEYSGELKKIRTEFREQIDKQSEEAEKEKVEKNRSPARIRAEMDKFEKMYEQGRFLGKKEREFLSKMKKLSAELKSAKENDTGGGIREMKRDLRNAEKSQEKAHKNVEKAVSKAQDSHDLMAELSDEVDRLREKANKAQAGVTRAKREADSLHSRYIVALRCIHSMQDLLKTLEARDSGDAINDEQVEVTDLMTRLMSGDTLSTDEIMALQRN